MLLSLYVRKVINIIGVIMINVDDLFPVRKSCVIILEYGTQ